MNKEKDLEIVQEHISYERLLQIARKMHLWIFLHSGDDNYEYKKWGLRKKKMQCLVVFM